MRTSCLILAIVTVCLPMQAEEELPLDRWYNPVPVPKKAKVSLELPKSVVIGQRMPAALVIENTGAKEFQIHPGGDYRSTGYPQRMKVRVRDAEGKALPELSRESYGFGGGGISVPRKVPPDGRDKVEFPLECYVSFTKAGEYTVIAGHDLGWEVGPGFPIATAKITVTEPTAAEAEEWVLKSLPKPLDLDANVGQQSYELDHTASVMRHPVYLSALKRRAEEGSVSAVAGIGHIATPEATKALIALTAHKHVPVVKQALQQILQRMPEMDDPARTALPGWGRSRYLVEPLLPGSWDEAFDKPMMEVMARCLEHSDREVLQSASQLVQARGTAELAPLMLKKLQAALDAPMQPREGIKADTISFPVPQWALIAALDALRARGWRTKAPHKMAETVAWFRQVADEEVRQPVLDAWGGDILVWVENGPVAVKICALEALPQPLSDAALPVVTRALDDRDWGVVRTACEVAGKSKRPEFVPALVQIVETMHESFLSRSAIEAAKSCGARRSLLDAIATSIVVQERMADMVAELAKMTLDLTVGNGWGGDTNFDREQRFAIRDAWRAFLQEHAADFAKGRKVRPPSAEKTAALTGMNFRPDNPVIRLQLKDGSRWPPEPKEK